MNTACKVPTKETDCAAGVAPIDRPLVALLLVGKGLGRGLGGKTGGGTDTDYSRPSQNQF